jgi:FKBP-type peptidyl-prolyl cis-trans isomerase
MNVASLRVVQSSVLFLLAAIAIAPQGAEIDLSKLANQTLSPEDRISSKLRDFLRKVTGETVVFGSRGSSYIWQYHDQFLVLEERPPMMVPGAGSMVLYQFDNRQRFVRSGVIRSGWRSYPASSKLLSVKGIDAPVICSDIQTWGAGTVKLYTSLTNGRLVTTRFENEKGERLPVQFAAPNWTVGAEFPTYDKAGLLATLRGPSPAEQLEALCWLTGEHQRPSVVISPVYQEPIGESLRYWTLLADPDVRRELQNLAESPVTWVAEGAKLAAKVKQLSVARSTPTSRTTRLVVRDLKVGQGTEWLPSSRELAKGDRGLFHVSCRPTDGKVIYSTREAGRVPVTIEAASNSVISGLSMGVAGMRPGGVRELRIPASLAFGPTGTAEVPPDADLVYDLTLIHILSKQDWITDGVFGQRDVKVGSSAKAKTGDRVVMTWTCRTIDGKMLETLEREQRAEFTLADNPFSMAVKGMRVGGVRRVLLRDFNTFANKNPSWFFGCIAVEIHLTSIRPSKSRARNEAQEPIRSSKIHSGIHEVRVY